MDFGALSAESRWTLNVIVPRLVDGFTRAEVSSMYGWQPSMVTSLVAQLRSELRAQLDDEPAPPVRHRPW